MALFQFWNQYRFSNPFSVTRSDLMDLSKIKSKTTYSKCLRELHTWKYLLYEPSNNPLAKSSFEMINVWSASWPKIAPEPNSTGPINGPPVDSTGSLNGLPMASTGPVNGLPLVPLYKTNKHKHINVEAPPDQNLVIAFFFENDAAKDEALKFWNHYESTGWKVGNSKIKNWEAAATKWLIGNRQRNTKQLVQKMDHLHTTKIKNYGKPL